MSKDPLHAQRLVESLLFLAGRPLSVKRMAEITQLSVKEVESAAEVLMQAYSVPERGVSIMKVGSHYQMATSAETSHIVKEFIKSELAGELTKPSLETLTIIAYCGPIAKAELEHIRGVNCSLILRNLLIKGLVESREDRTKMTTVYQVTFEFLQFLGITRAEDLPDYERLRNHEHITKVIEAQRAEAQSTPTQAPETPAQPPEGSHDQED